MKFSEAMLKGFEKVDGRQCKGTYWKFGAGGGRPVACCVAGAVGLGSGNGLVRMAFRASFKRAWGIDPSELNDEGMQWEELYGMTVAAGL